MSGVCNSVYWKLYRFSLTLRLTHCNVIWSYRISLCIGVSIRVRRRLQKCIYEEESIRFINISDKLVSVFIDKDIQNEWIFHAYYEALIWTMIHALGIHYYRVRTGMWFHWRKISMTSKSRKSAYSSQLFPVPLFKLNQPMHADLRRARVIFFEQKNYSSFIAEKTGTMATRSHEG